ncbi:MAG: lipoprotein signal peptidase [Bacteroidales bacterium]|jgi:signal peptidase II|nr:lipoprotein signal peptidase [Bacteroidales bacterium]
MSKQMTNTQKGWLLAGIILLIVLLDQALKIYIKLNFCLGEAVEVFPWWQICFIENNGMAFGIEWFGKLFLTLFRIVAVGLLIWYMVELIRKHVRMGYLVMIALVTAGALGNIIDCMFYGLIFSESTINVAAHLVPFGEGYAPFFYGKVVDMLYFPLITNSAGEVLFFRPVFNLADSAITVSVILILLFFRKDLNDTLTNEKETKQVEA